MNLITQSSFIFLPSAISLDVAFGSDIVQMIIHAGLMVRFILFVLFSFSVVSWTIIFMKWRLFRTAKRETALFLDLFWETTEMNKIFRESDYLVLSPVAHLFRAGHSELKRISKLESLPRSNPGNMILQPLMINLERALKKTTLDQSNRLERALSFLATTGNACPFIGLFGTVWGIMESFRGIGLRGSASLAVVAPGISEALIATAAGLAAAIPAVVAYNYFSQKAVLLRSEMDSFSSDFLALVERQFFKRQMAMQEQAQSQG